MGGPCVGLLQGNTSQDICRNPWPGVRVPTMGEYVLRVRQGRPGGAPGRWLMVGHHESRVLSFTISKTCLFISYVICIHIYVLLYGILVMENFYMHILS